MKYEFRAMNRNGKRHITVNYDVKTDGEVVVGLWDGGFISTQRVVDTMEEAKDISRGRIDGTILQ